MTVNKGKVLKTSNEFLFGWLDAHFSNSRYGWYKPCSDQGRPKKIRPSREYTKILKF